jgi:hypothetical protein
MATVIGDICAPTGKYIDRNTNEEKTSWAKCGVLMKTDKGYRIKLDTVPVGGQEQGVWFSVFEKEGRGQGSGQKPASRQSDGFEDDTPF